MHQVPNRPNVLFVIGNLILSFEATQCVIFHWKFETRTLFMIGYTLGRSFRDHAGQMLNHHSIYNVH